MIIQTENTPTTNNFQKTDSFVKISNNPHPPKMKNADRPFLLIILIAISLLYTFMAFLS
jgi:hypothetical protein